MASDNPQFAMLPWFPRDFSSSTRDFPLIARAVYRELLDLQWDLGSLPSDPAALRGLINASASEWRRAWPYVEPKLPIREDGRRRNQRLEIHREKSIRRHQQAAEAARKRWQKEEA